MVAATFLVRKGVCCCPEAAAIQVGRRTSPSAVLSCTLEGSGSTTTNTLFSGSRKGDGARLCSRMLGTKLRPRLKQRVSGVTMVAVMPKWGNRAKDEDWLFDPLGLGAAARPAFERGQPQEEESGLLAPLFRLVGGRGPNRQPSEGSSSRGSGPGTGKGPEDTSIGIEDFFKGKLPGKLLELLLLLALSRVGVYLPLPGVNVSAFAGSVDQEGFLGLINTLSGGGIARVGVFSLGIVPYINAQIILQLASTVFPKLGDLQKKEGELGRKKVENYTRYAALGLALAQAVSQVLFLKPYAYHFDSGFFGASVLILTAGAMIEVFIADSLGALKLGSGTSLLIFTNIVSYLPASIGRTATDAANTGNWAGLTGILATFIVLIGGIIYVQEAERKIPINYASQYRAGRLSTKSYLPFKVNATGVMPVIFASSLLVAPSSLARFTDAAFLKTIAVALYPGGPLYLPTNVALIGFFNYFYTFVQMDPDEVGENLKKAGASIPNTRPGKATAAYIEAILTRMSILGSVFLGILAVAPEIAENTTHLTAFRGFAGTSVLILVGVATDSARKIQAELVSQKYLTTDADTY